MPLLPADFVFTQANLQDYADCRRRFWLRHVLELAWPAVEAEPAGEHEAHVRDGEAFHRLVHQHLLGVVGEGAAPGGEGNLEAWWRAYLEAPPAGLPAQRHPEITLSAPLGERRLIAKYDLVAVEPGRRAVIVDWKTSAHRPAQGWLAARLQTRVYRYVLAEAGAHLNGGQPLRPEQITMLYWFANFPADPERLPYDETQHRAGARYLASLAGEIAAADLSEEEFPLTAEVKRCRFCPYRSLCGRGVEAGDMSDAGEEAGDPEDAAPDWAAGFDFEQVGEIAF